MNLPFDKPKPKPKPYAQDLWDRVGSLRDLVNCYSLDRFESASTEVALQDVARERTEEDRFLAGEGALGLLLNYFDHAGKSKYCILHVGLCKGLLQDMNEFFFKKKSRFTLKKKFVTFR